MNRLLAILLLLAPLCHAQRATLRDPGMLSQFAPKGSAVVYQLFLPTNNLQLWYSVSFIQSNNLQRIDTLRDRSTNGKSLISASGGTLFKNVPMFNGLDIISNNANMYSVADDWSGFTNFTLFFVFSLLPNSSSSWFYEYTAAAGISNAVNMYGKPDTGNIAPLIADRYHNTSLSVNVASNTPIAMSVVIDKSASKAMSVFTNGVFVGSTGTGYSNAWENSSLFINGHSGGASSAKFLWAEFAVWNTSLSAYDQCSAYYYFQKTYLIGAPVTALAFQQQPTPSVIGVGGSTLVTAQVTNGTPSLAINCALFQWYSNSIAIVGATNPIATLTPASTNDTFYCLVTNQVGYVQSSNVTVSSSLLNGLVAYYKLDESSGATPLDSFGANNLVDVGTVPRVSGLINNAASFTNGSAKYLIAPISTTFSLTNNLSVNCWALLRGAPSGTEWNLLSSWSAPDAKGQYILTVLGYGGANLGWQFGAMTNGAVAGNQVNAQTAPTTNAWVMVTGVRSNGAIFLYTNSVLVGSLAIATGSLQTYTTNYQFRIGEYGAPGTYAPNGKVDLVGVWSTNLSSGAISNLYYCGTNSTKIDFPFQGIP